MANQTQSWVKSTKGTASIRGSFLHQLTNAGDDLAAEQLDVGHESLVGQPAGAVLQVKAAGTQRAQVGHDLLGDRLGGSDIKRAPWPNLVGEGLLGGNREAALDRDEPDQLAPVRPELFTRLFVCCRHMTGSVHANRKRLSAEVRERLLKEPSKRGEARRRPTDDRQHQGEAQTGGANDRLRAATYTDPGGQAASVLEIRDDVLVVQWRSGGALPGDRTTFEHLGEERGLLLKQLLVVGQVVAE